MRTHLNHIHKWVNLIWHLVWGEHLSFSFLPGFGTTQSYWSVETNCLGLTVLLPLTLNLIWSTNSLRKPIGSARSDQFRRADTQIKSHRSVKRVIYDPLPMFSFFSLSSPPSYFTLAHNILTKSFFDGRISHDSRKVAPLWGRESVKAKCEEAEMETEELIKLIHLVGCEGRERQAEKISHSLIFLNTLYESYRITGCIMKPLRIQTDFLIITLLLPFAL